ncbi:MAG: COX15/CtaA family protein [Bdellovibrionales bacterium]
MAKDRSKPATKSSSRRKPGFRANSKQIPDQVRDDVHGLILWLYTVAGLVFTMVMIGAITRLTDSGLSMVEWRPVFGFLPPMNEAEWTRVFDLYKASPEFAKKHFWMGIEDFKAIFFWEYLHRVLGRVIGLVFALPLLWFWLRKQIPAGYGWKLIGMLVLGGLQGFMGWYMVKSGLVNDPYVSHYRLSAHLTIAFLIFSLLIWLALSLQNPQRTGNKALFAHSWFVLGMVTLTIFWGAYTAGLDAGLIYNETFPKMGGQWIPPTINQFTPYWLNFFETPEGVQFTHRWLAMTSVIAMISLWAHAVAKRSASWPVHALAGMSLLQLTLGITTLLSKVYVPIAVLHQAGALVLLGLLITTLHRYNPKN